MIKELIREIEGLQNGSLMAHADGSVTEDINVGDEEHSVWARISQEDSLCGECGQNLSTKDEREHELCSWCWGNFVYSLRN